MKIAYLTIALAIIFFPSRREYVSQGYNKYTVMLGGVYVGTTDSLNDIYDCYRQARLELCMEQENKMDLYMADYAPITYEGEEVIFGTEDKPEFIINNMKDVLRGNKVSTYEHSYSVKVNSDVINVASSEDIVDVFQNVIDRYSGGEGFEITLDGDSNRELSVLTVSVNKLDSAAKENEIEESVLPNTGAESCFDADVLIEEEQDISFDSFEYGIVEMGFSNTIEVCESYVPADEIMSLDEAKNYFTETKDVQEIYKVESGDTLSEISMKVNLPMDDIIALNDSLEDTRSLIVPGQELIITSPKPALSVLWSYQAKVNEVYDLPIEYIYNDSWYTNQTQTLQQPSAGSHDAVLLVAKENSSEVGSQVLYEEVLAVPIAKVVEKGTIIPPTYIKPLSGGRQTSGFGRRNSPTKGASSNHKGVDWATPVGTTVVASCGGTVVFAGWGSGYGNVIYINHPDGRQTRYGHLSRILVSNGQTVSQGQRIAYSGNTGVSTGPHVHFEILINGTQVNPLNYIN